MIGDEHTRINLDMTEFMRHAERAERAMNELVNEPSHPLTRTLSDAEVGAVCEELRKAGFDPAVMAVRDGE